MDKSQGKLTLILGGARSGKSRLAEEMALAAGGEAAYIATAAVWDGEMAHRVALHRERRPAHWHTIEEERDLAKALEQVPTGTGTVIVDCLTLWLTNRLLAGYDENASAEELAGLEQSIRGELDTFCLTARRMPFHTLVVSNEVGCGIVPESPLSRFFRDLAGRANQQTAAAADSVYLVVAGCPLQIKGKA
jgi:adenosylcobinamide kinase / adenosylcobinamide-phosphate guanylyltransferase